MDENKVWILHISAVAAIKTYAIGRQKNMVQNNITHSQQICEPTF